MTDAAATAVEPEVERQTIAPARVAGMKQGPVSVTATLEDGTLVRNGEVKLAKPLASLRIPPTVQGILAARIDRLARSREPRSRPQRAGINHLPHSKRRRRSRCKRRAPGNVVLRRSNAFRL